MPKITYEEFKSGHWVKVVDGRIVGPATAAEVAAWKQEKAAPARIWEDVVATASRPPFGEVAAASRLPSGEVATASRPPFGEVATASRPPSGEVAAASRPGPGEIKVAKPPAVKVGTPSRVLGGAGAPVQPGTPKEPEPSTIWEDLVKRSQRPVRAEGPPRPRPRKEDTDQAEQAQIWQDVVKRVKRPEPEPQSTKAAPISPQPAPAMKPEPATRPSLPTTAKPAQAAPPLPTAEPAGEGTIAKKAFAAEILTPRLATPALKPTAGAKVDRYSIPSSVRGEKAAPARKAPDKPAPKPAPPAKPTAKAEAKPSREHAPKVRATKAAAKEKPAVKVAPARKTAAPSEPHKPAAKERLPAKLLDEIAEQESVPAEEAVFSAPRHKVPPSSGRKRAGPEPKSSTAAVPRRTVGRGKTAPTQERPNQLYLWISAGQADDLVAAVRTGLARYQERFSHAAEVVLCHSADLPTLEGAKLPVDLREGKSLAPRNFWIGSK